MIKYATKDRPIRDNILLRHRILINKKKNYNNNNNNNTLPKKQVLGAKFFSQGWDSRSQIHCTTICGTAESTGDSTRREALHKGQLEWLVSHVSTHSE